ncbi:unnamed protein product [Aspergillus oryzae]|uniref:Unnamed protein product n=2 Tax=Aspergillus oryzae TaxID=5062 RepID=A0AAN4Y8Y3_ASPOZ|nr:unnamed protein product [Aspergillus oryzae]GMF87938.1 unnamed protein product [Aspergillus oryzae]GMG06437.1 unnamed protein product [Aspergillus oryzae]GMG24273.1 unnamed protein product [Aspergillus oryzae]GMG47555.1 unnamed protein product [Aspergillus oryzae var. brunneus]
MGAKSLLSTVLHLWSKAGLRCKEHPGYGCITPWSMLDFDPHTDLFAFDCLFGSEHRRMKSVQVVSMYELWGWREHSKPRPAIDNNNDQLAELA